MSLKNKIIQGITLLFKLFSRSHEPSTDSPRLLVVSTTGLGDTLWATPSLKVLKGSFPRSYVALLTTPIGKELLKYNPYIDELFVIKGASLFSLFPLFFSIRKKKIDTALLFHTSQRLILPFCRWIGASRLIGTKNLNKGLDALLTTALPEVPVHEIDRRLKIVNTLKPCFKVQQPSLELFLSEGDEAEATTFLERNQLPPSLPLIGIHPGAKERFKRWPSHLFVELAKRLRDHLLSECQIFITGGEDPSEKELVRTMTSAIPGAISTSGKLSLRGVAALIKRMALFISNDTGPMHIGFAMGTPTVALFTPTDPKLCGPSLAPNSLVISRLPTCTPCLRKKCQEPFCLLQISVDEVYEAALKLFKENLYA
jgi:ADP-heptose:LPS heptosyltransferase